MNDNRDLIPITGDSALESRQPPAVHPVIAYLAGLGSDRSRAVMRDDLAIIAAIIAGIDPDSVSAGERRDLILQVDWPTLRIAHTNAIRARLAARYDSHHTANRMLSALRGVLKACWQQNLMTAEEYHRARAVEAVKGHTLPTGRDLGVGERGALFAVCLEDEKNPNAGARDAALLACADAGLRRSEIVSLDLADFDGQKGLKVRGKGNKQRWVPLNRGQQHALEDWLAVRGSEPGPLLWPVNKGGNMSNRRLTSQTIYKAMLKRGEQAGVDQFSPHDFRRTLVGDLLDAGADISTVQRIMGHADPTTTARYDRRPEEAKRKAVEKRHTPYTGRT